jgi:hypothetical protein
MQGGMFVFCLFDGVGWIDANTREELTEHVHPFRAHPDMDQVVV